MLAKALFSEKMALMPLALRFVFVSPHSFAYKQIVVIKYSFVNFGARDCDRDCASRT